MLGQFTTASRLTPIQQMSLAVLSRAACASMPTTSTTTTTTTRDRGDRYGPMERAQWDRSLPSESSFRYRRRPCGFFYKIADRCKQVSCVQAANDALLICVGYSSRREKWWCHVFTIPKMSLSWQYGYCRCCLQQQQQQQQLPVLLLTVTFPTTSVYHFHSVIVFSFQF